MPVVHSYRVLRVNVVGWLVACAMAACSIRPPAEPPAPGKAANAANVAHANPGPADTLPQLNIPVHVDSAAIHAIVTEGMERSHVGAGLPVSDGMSSDRGSPARPSNGTRRTGRARSSTITASIVHGLRAGHSAARGSAARSRSRC